MAARMACHATLVMVLAVLLLAAPAATAQPARPAMSRTPTEAVGEIPSSDEATQGQAVARTSAVGQHAVLLPYEQCGGHKGLCKTSTIAAPCGDHPWGLECPTGFECKRKTSDVWLCNPNKNNTAGVTDTGNLVVPVSNSTTDHPSWQDLASSADSTNSTVATTPEVKACPPGAIAVGSRCFRSSATSRRGVAGTLAGSIALLAAWQLAVVLTTALLSC